MASGRGGGGGGRRPRRKLWAYTAGRYGFRVRVFERPGRPSITVAYWDAAAGKTCKRSLGHGDRGRAKDEAEQLAQQLRTTACDGPTPAQGSASSGVSVVLAGGGAGGGGGPPAAHPPADLTLASLFDEYEAREVRHRRRPEEYRRRLTIWRHFLAAEGVVRVADLDDSHGSAFVAQRRHGDLQVEVPGADGTVTRLRLPTPAPPAVGQERRAAVVSERTIGADLEFLHGVLNWGTRRKVGGVPLVVGNPLTARKHQTPASQRRRPLATEDDHRALVRVADRVDGQILLGCFLRLLDDLGWRVTGLCHVRASDLDLAPGFGRPYGAVRKNALVDKEQVEDWVPLSRHARATVGRLLRRRGLTAGERAFLFPAPRAAGQPWSRYHVRDLIERAEAAAGVAHVGGAHAWRRKWATERKGHPEADLMRAGGWRDPRSLKGAYTRPDAAATYAVVSRRTGVVRRSS